MTSGGAGRFAFVYNVRTGRYRNVATGRFIGSDDAADAVQEAIDATINEMDSMLNAVLNENVDAGIGDWQRAMATRLRQLHGAMTLVGAGGVNNITQADWGRLGATLKGEYRYLAQFAADMPGLSEKQIRSRMRMYADKVWSSFWTAKTNAIQRDTDATHERRFLRPAEHCDDCIRLAGMGYQPIGMLPDPGDGSTECLSNDRCVKKYYRKEGSNYIHIG